jgi:hypothetical protein
VNLKKTYRPKFISCRTDRKGRREATFSNRQLSIVWL